MFNKEGPTAFYKGITPRIIRVAPGQAITFTVYEFLKGKLDRSSAIDGHTDIGASTGKGPGIGDGVGAITTTDGRGTTGGGLSTTDGGLSATGGGLSTTDGSGSVDTADGGIGVGVGAPGLIYEE